MEVLRAGVMAPKAASYMTSPVITAKSSDNLLHVRNLMIRHRISRVVIMEDGEVNGIVCKSDFTKILFNRKRYLKPMDAIAASEIMSSPVYAVSPDRSIKSVAKCMIRYEIGSLLVIDNDKNLCGIITATDVLKAFSEKYRGMLRVTDVMSRNPATAYPTHSIFYVIDGLVHSGSKSVIVVNEDNEPLGIITRSDILTLFFNFNTSVSLSPLSQKHTRSLCAILKSGVVPIASDVMTRDPITINYDEDLAVAADIMVKNKISNLPVVNQTNTLVGIVTKDDIIKALKSL